MSFSPETPGDEGPPRRSEPDRRPRRGSSARRVDRWVVELADALRVEGLGIGVGQAVACRRALSVLDPSGRLAADGDADRYWAARVCMVSDPAQLAVFERVFRRHEADGADPHPPDPRAEPVADAGSDRPAGGAEADAPLVAGMLASRWERLRHRRFAEASDDELAEIGQALQRLRVGIPHRISRRTRAGRRGELDLGRTLERALTTDGELVERAWRTRRTRPRRLVVVLDVSGSMATHARLLLRFALAARRTADVDVARRVEVFAFSTRLTRLSDQLAMRDPDQAIAAAASRVVDWDGGTRIGASIGELVRVWGRRGVLHGAIVVICSDGLERGDPAELAAAMGRLARLARRIVWVNPLVAGEDFAPVQRGMAAALPYVDTLRSGDDLASLEMLARTIE